MPENTPNLDSLFEAAAEIASADERAAYLDKSCGDNLELRKQLEQLLQSDQQAGSFLKKPAPGLEETIVPDASEDNRAASLEAGLATAFSSNDAVVIGDANHSVLKMLGNTLNEVPRVSLRESEAEGDDPISRPGSPEMPQHNSDQRYQLQGEIARGGMGAIIKGRDTDLGRDLAIKVLLEAHKDKPEVIQRFVEEAQIGGQLQHPGIAPIYELGQFADKRPFFAMKLVKGETLAKLLADREDATDARGKLIGIFEQICQTMAYAHSRGVIHRDLKPANIMVGAFGEVQVMDWGLAKVLPSGGVADEKKAKQSHQGTSIIQTMRSTGSDVPGSFGSTGSETQMGSVMGTPAYMPPEQALGEIDQMDQRADVFGLGAILCEILTGKPPYVGDDGTQVYRMASRGKLDDAFERLDGCAADAELVALSKHCLELEPAKRPRDASVLAQRITAYLESVEQKLRDTELAKADALVRAEELRRRQRLAYTAGTAIVATLLIGISASLWQMVRANTAEKLARDETARATAAELLAKHEAVRATTAEKETADTLVQVEKERDAKDLARKDAEQISIFLSEVLKSPDPTKDGREIKVVELLDNAAKKLETDLADQPERRAKLQATLSHTYYALGLCRQAIPLQEQVRDHYLSTAGPEHLDTLAAMHGLAISYCAAGRRDEALKLQEEVLTLRRKVSGAEHPHTLNAMHNLAVSYHHAGRNDEALKLQEEVLTLSRKVSGAEHPDTLNAMQNLASFYHDGGRRDEAMKLREEVLTLSRKVSGPEHPATLNAVQNLAVSYHHAGRKDESLKLREEMLTLNLKVLGPEHPETLRAMKNLASFYYNAGRRDEALKLREEVLTLSLKVLGPEHPDLADKYSDLGFSLPEGREAEVIEAWQKALEINPKLHSNAAYYLGVLLERAEEPVEAFIAYLTSIRNGAMTRQANEKSQQILKDPENVEACLLAVKAKPELMLLASTAFAATGHAEKAMPLLMEFAAEVLAKRPDDADAHNEAAWRLATRPDQNRGYPHAKQAVALARRAIELAPNNGGLLNTLGVALYRAEEWQETIDVLQQSTKHGFDVPANWLFIAMAHWQLDQKDQAKQWYDKSLAWQTANAADAQADAELQGFFAEAAKLMTELLEARLDDQTTDVTGLSQRAAAYLAKEHYDLARADWLRVVKLQPQQVQPAFNAFRKANQWSIAAEFGQQLVDQKPEDSSRWIQVAPVVVYSGDEELYANFCQSILKQSLTTHDTAERAIKVCLLRSSAVDVSDLPGETLATALDQETAPTGFRPWGWATRALLAYRSGDAESAVKYVAKSEANNPADFTHAMNLAVLAMAHHKLEHSDEAETALEKASKLITTLNKAGKKGAHDLLVAEILFHEAEANINGKNDSANEASTPPEKPTTTPAEQRPKASSDEPENGDSN